MKVAEELYEALGGYQMTIPDAVDIAKDGVLNDPDSRAKLINLVAKGAVALGIGWPVIQKLIGG